MSTLHLVRHAQASFLEADYDKLSPLGEEQARRLGAYWARRGVRFDAIFVGPRRRHRDTARIALDVLRAENVVLPETIDIDALDEYHAEELMTRNLPKLADLDPKWREELDAFGRASERRDRARRFERIFQEAMRLWAAGRIDDEEVESWSAFRTRVQGALETLTGGTGRGLEIVAFSSGGAIGAMVAEVLGTDADRALDLGWTLQNASVTELLFRPGRVNLSRFNATPHLEDPSLATYR